MIRNHEIDGELGAFATAPRTTVRPAAARRRWSSTRLRVPSRKRGPASCGTTRNCAGGPTPWGTWLTCEETLAEPRPANRFTQPHGYVFEVPAEGAATAVPLKGLGRFVHEAVAIDPDTGIVYLTEDHLTAGFYRFVPKTPGTLAEGGRLEMLAVSGRANFDTRMGQQRGRPLPVRWVPIADPDRPHRVNDRGDGEGVSSQGRTRAPPSLRGSKARGTAAGRCFSTRPAVATRAAARFGSTYRRASNSSWSSNPQGRTR